MKYESYNPVINTGNQLTIPGLYPYLLKQTHLLIAGTTGSGKSVIENSMLYVAMHYDYRFILIDVKRVELNQYKNLPHTVYYASEPGEPVKALQIALQICENRYKEMQRTGIKKYTGPRLLVVIDEIADLMVTNKREIKPLLQRLCQIGRAANIMVIACTQTPIATVIPTEIKVNFDSRLALRTRSKQDSRNIIDLPGCETFPRYGKGYLSTPEKTGIVNIEMIPEKQIQDYINRWLDYKPPQKKKSLLSWIH